MIATLTGVNSFGIQQELSKLITPFVKKHGDFALERVDAEDSSYEHLLEVLTSLPFLTSKKMVVLRAPSKNKKFNENIEQILHNIPGTTDVIILEPKIDKRLSYYKFLRSKTDYRQYDELDHDELLRWLESTAQTQGATLDKKDADYLVERIGLHQQLLANELEKLILYDEYITRGNIDLLTDETPQSTIFQLLEAAFAGNSKRVMTLYREQRALNVELPQIIAMLAWQLHILALIKTSGDRSPEAIAKQAKVNPFVVRKSQNIARNIPLKRLKQLTHDLLKIDVSSKTNNLDLDEAIQYYLLSIAS